MKEAKSSSVELVPVSNDVYHQTHRRGSYEGAMEDKMSSLHEGRTVVCTRGRVWRTLVRPCVCEFFLTMMFVGASTMGGVVVGDIVQVAFLNGFTIYSLIMIGLDVSGAQMNPAVSFGLFLSGAQAFDVTVGYFLSQLFGATAGAGITRALVRSNATSFPDTFALVLPTVENQSHFQSMLTEAYLEFILVLLILVTIVEKDAKDMFGPLVVGIWVGTAILAGGKLSGGSMNPARAFGAALAFNNGWGEVWIYFGGGFLGATLASLAYRFFFAKCAVRLPFLAALDPSLDAAV